MLSSSSSYSLVLIGKILLLVLFVIWFGGSCNILLCPLGVIAVVEFV